MNNHSVKKLCVLAMLGALAYIVMYVGRIPIVLFLKYDPKDIIITIGGFLYGPMAAFAITVIVSLAEMVTVSTTGPIGFLMNVIAGCSFACTAAFIYKKNRSLKGAVIGLAAAWIFTTVVMVLWNYLVTPLYMSADGVSVAVVREQVAGLMLPAFVPFNLLKGGLNAALTMLLYKPVKRALQKAGLMPDAAADAGKRKLNFGVIGVSVFVVLTCVLWVLVLQGKL